MLSLSFDYGGLQANVNSRAVVKSIVSRKTMRNERHPLNLAISRRQKVISSPRICRIWPHDGTTNACKEDISNVYYCSGHCP
jgi:hypothetical protein